MTSIDNLVPNNHNYRKFHKIWSFKQAERILKKAESSANYKGYGVLCLFKCLLLQFMEDLSDRELERYLSDTNSAKWFCGFTLLSKTPVYSVFSKFRSRIGTDLLTKLFND